MLCAEHIIICHSTQHAQSNLINTLAILTMTLKIASFDSYLVKEDLCWGFLQGLSLLFILLINFSY